MLTGTPLYRTSLIFVLVVGTLSTIAWLVWSKSQRIAPVSPIHIGVYLVSSLPLILVNLGARFIKWHYLVRTLLPSVPIRASAIAFLSGLAGIASPGYVAEFAFGSLFLSMVAREGLGRTVLIPVLARLADLVALSLITCLAGLGARVRGITVYGPLIGVAMALFCLFSLVLLYLLHRQRKDADWQQQQRALPVRGTYLRCVGVAVAAWIVASLMVARAGAAVGVIVPVDTAILAFSSGTVAGALTLLPAGVIATGSVLGHSLIYGSIADAGSAAAISALVRLTSLGAGLGLGLLGLSLQVRTYRSAWRTTQERFEEIAAVYDRDIPSHVRDRLLDRKSGFILDALAHLRAGGERIAWGLDLGCGYGWYQQRILSTSPQARILGLDRSGRQLAQGRAWWEKRKQEHALMMAQADVTRLPVGGGAIDFAYSINLFHHLGTRAAQEAALAEVCRVLKPGGVFSLHEMNVENPVFRAYMGYLFPLIRQIDDGTEIWLRPTALPAFTAGMPLELVRVDYFTFLPDFVPQRIARWLAPVERWLERSRWRHWSAHYAACFVRTSEPPARVMGGRLDARGNPVSSLSRRERS